MVAGGVAAAVALLLLLGIPTVARQNDISDQRGLRDRQEQRNLSLQAQIGQLADEQAKQDRLDALSQQIATLVAVDVSWSRMLQDIARTIPNDVWLTTFQGAVTPAVQLQAPTPTTAAPGETTTTTASDTTPTTTPAPVAELSGTVNFSAVGLDYPSVAAWLKMISQLPSLADLWVPNITKTALGTREVVNFTSTATLTPKARSDRLERYRGIK